MTSSWIPPVVVGSCEFDSVLFSNRWRLTRDGETLAELHRDPTCHTSSGVLADGTRLELTPQGWGTILVTADEMPLGRIDRRSWWGRHWEISGTGFGCDLTSDLMPRRWTYRLGGEPIGQLAGGLFSYNRLEVETDVSMPVHALVLSWHVLARPWEAATVPRALVPDRSPE